MLIVKRIFLTDLICRLKYYEETGSASVYFVCGRSILRKQINLFLLTAQNFTQNGACRKSALRSKKRNFLRKNFSSLCEKHDTFVVFPIKLGQNSVCFVTTRKPRKKILRNHVLQFNPESVKNIFFGMWTINSTICISAFSHG